MTGRAAHHRRGQGQAARSGQRGQGDGLSWPGYRRQLGLLAQLPPGEAQAAEGRARLLIEAGYGALLPWLQAAGAHPGERSGDSP